MEQAKTWLNLSKPLAFLHALKKCHLTLDLSGPEVWWELNEPALLSPFTSLAHRPTITFTVSLPSHAVDNVPLPPPFSTCIHRYPRRWHFGEANTSGELKVRLSRQFPLNMAFADFIARSPDFGAFDPMPEQEKALEDFMAKLIERERGEWRDGVDVAGYVQREVDAYMPCGLGTL